MLPDSDVSVDVSQVRSLLHEQAPHLAHLPLRFAAEGWDNVMVRIGEDLVARLPRRASAVALLENEVAWAPHLADGLSLPIPAPVFVGAPGMGYPYPWAVMTWLAGIPAGEFGIASRDAYAPQLARFLAAFHRPVSEVFPLPDGGDSPSLPVNRVRGVPVAARSRIWWERLVDSVGMLPPDAVPALEEMIRRAEAAPAWDREVVWIHGDPHPQNMLAATEHAPSGSSAARLVAVLDLGDLTTGDPASDLGAAWLHFGPDGLRAFRAAYTHATGSDDALWTRAAGWAANYLLTLHTDHGPLGEAARAALTQIG